MTTDPEQNELTLPPELAAKFAAFEKRLRRMETIVSIFGALLGILFTYGLLFLSDRFWDTPAALRALLSLLGGAGFGYFAWRWLNRWYLKRRNAQELARLIQRHHKGMGDRLLGVVELANGTHPENASPALVRAAIAQVARESERVDFTEAVTGKTTRRLGMGLAGIAILVIIPFLVFPKAGWNALARWIAPMAKIERYTFVRIDQLPTEMVVAHGETFTLAVAVAESSQRMPSTGTAKFKQQPRIDQPVDDGGVLFTIPGQTTAGILTIRLGDDSREIMIQPEHRPELVSCEAIVQQPDYLMRPPETNTVLQGQLDVLENSQVTLTGTLSRPVKSVQAVSNDSFKVTVRGAQFNAAPVNVQGPLIFELAWEDTYGLKETMPYVLSVNTVEDRAPSISCTGASRTMAILEDEIVRLEIIANDDFGLKEIYVNWQSVGNKEKGMMDVGGSHTVSEGSPTATRLAGEYPFSPLIEHIPENTMITLSAFTTDYKPGREPTESVQYRIYVLNRAQHAKLIQDQIEALQGRIEDLAREEEALLEANENLRAQKPEQLEDEAASRELKEKELAENRNKEQLEQLAKESEELIKEAIRNRNIPESAIREWAEMSDGMKQLAENQMAKAAEALSEAGQQPQNRKEKLDEAIAMEREVVEQLEKMEKSVNESIENMVAQNFINRLMHISQEEDNLANALRILLPQIIGLNYDDLDSDQAEHVDLLTSRQLISRKEAGYIIEDMAGFYSRTQEEIYKTISEDMKTKDTLASLEKLADAVASNVGGQAIRDAKQWKEQFATWADQLKEATGNGGGGGGGGGEPPDDEELNMELLIALLRARQAEEGMREQTRMLEETRADNRLYEKDAKTLSTRQYDLSNEFGRAQRLTRDPRIKGLINQTSGEMMNAGLLMRRPQTDAETVAIETEIIELLSGTIDESSSGSSSAAAMLMAMMGMGAPAGPPGQGQGAGDSGGGNPAGGEALDTPDPMSGEANGLADEGREVDRASGMNPADFPEEFRDALEGFFNGLEEIN